MCIKKIIFVFIFSFFVSSVAMSAIKIEGKFKNWESHYTEDGKDKVCFAVSMPIKKDPSNLNRAEARIFVTFRTKRNVVDEVSITGGYPYKKDSQVSVGIDNASFKFDVSDNFAWLINNKDEVKIIQQMKKKNELKATGLSARGNKTYDTYSLLGFTDAYNSAKNKCKK